ncbi:MAG: creatininase family protein, partial [Actinomycetota bacterium]|nr:creatininase family protein [Actinomycetota bacterium]
MTRRFAELRAPQVDEVVSERSILIQPFGAVEQHGPHLPFNTDLVVADAISRAVITEFGEELDLFMLEPFAYTKSNEHAWSPGSIWMNPTTLLAMIDDLARSVAPLPARKIVFINGHGGNSSL